jgi:hypothetical protein
MRRLLRPHPTQLTLRLAPEPEPVLPLITSGEPTLVQALADLLLSALGQPTPGDQTRAATATEGGDEPEDHA